VTNCKRNFFLNLQKYSTLPCNIGLVALSIMSGEIIVTSLPVILFNASLQVSMLLRCCFSFLKHVVILLKELLKEVHLCCTMRTAGVIQSSWALFRLKNIWFHASSDLPTMHIYFFQKGTLMACYTKWSVWEYVDKLKLFTLLLAVLYCTVFRAKCIRIGKPLCAKRARGRRAGKVLQC
jgi:hypothetical protein